MHHDDFKLIRKDIAKLDEYLKEAHSLNIDLDNDLMQEVNNFTARLTSERDMRKRHALMLENAISKCEHKDINEISGLLEEAKSTNVESEYVVASEKLLG